MPDVGEEGPDRDLNHVEVNQDPEEPQTSFANKGKLWFMRAMCGSRTNGWSLPGVMSD
jgi:hypothetical protein